MQLLLRLIRHAHHVGAALTVRSVKLEGISKADAIFGELGDDERPAVFADDDIAELTDPRVAADPRLHRVLFLRG